jgi:predicted anti-sigma-YlaC factor YlaD
MRCQQLEQQWEDWLEGRDAPELAAHLQACADCRTMAAELRGLNAMVPLLRDEPPALAPGFWLRLRERIEATERQEAYWAAFNFLAGRAAAVLAVLLLVLSLLTLHQQPLTSVTGIDTVQETSTIPNVELSNGELTQDQVLVSLVETDVKP